MKPENFSAWELDPSAFDAQPADRRLDFLVRFAVLAPSGHNSQPWKFVVERDAVIVSAEMARALPQSDANHRQLHLSVGCAIENLRLAADYYGYRVEVSRETKNGMTVWRIRCSGDPAPAGERHADHPALAIPRRRTNRNAYETRLPEAAYLDWLRGLSEDGLEIRLVAEEPQKTKIAAIVSDALIDAMDDDGFRFELSKYIRPNITGAKTGMPMYGFGMPTPLSFLAPTIVKKVNVNRASRKRDEALLNAHTPVFAVISTRGDDPAAWVEAGGVYERAALEAERRGISTAPLAAAIQIGEHFRRLQEALGTALRPQVFFRLGYAVKIPKHSPRIPAAEVIEKDNAGIA